MRISLNWLRELVALDGSAQELAERLTLAGFEVEDIEDRSTWADGVVVGKVLVRDKHPNADKLSVCQVDIGQDEPSTIVCGAPNVQAGLFVPVATLGTYLPNVDLKIKPAKLRGVPSAGMICSLSELGLTKDSEGIHVFDPKQQSFKVGDDVRPLLGLDDAILDLSSTANRADALSMVGIAREVAALQGTSQIDLPKIPNLKIPTKGPAIAIEVDDAQACPAYIATRLDGIKVAPSPEWLKRHLEAAGTRPINNVVDITNYILLEWGQPLHAFDADALSAVAGGSSLTLGVRFAKTGETLKTLDGQGRSLSPQNLLITANEHPIALAGVMGGEETEVRETTTSIVLEAALFSSIGVRRSARAQGLRSEASTRYERGVNETQLDLACRHAVALLQELAGGKLVAQNIADSRTPQQRSIELRLSRINQLLGPLEGPDDESLEELTGEQVTQLLESLGFIPAPTDKSDVWNVEVPPHRHRDIEREIDLIEEVARLHGYDKFCDTLPSKTEPGYLAADDVIIRQIREAFRANGLTELIHYTWTKPGEDDSHQIQVSNPLLVEFSALRTEMLTGLLTAFQYNLEQGNGPLNGFEIGRIFWKEEDGLAEAHALAGIVSGKPLQGKWLTAKKDTTLSWFEAKGILEGVFQRLDIAVEYQPDRQDTRLHPGRTASLWIEGERLGRFGQIHPQLRQERDLPEDVYGFELDLEVLVRLQTLLAFPSIRSRFGLLCRNPYLRDRTGARDAESGHHF
jgi:phenylalanyl-tRNA synthetase beta chain